MTIDRYTKIVLTVIAFALLYIGAMLSGAPLTAQSTMALASNDQKPQPVVIVGWGTMAADGAIRLTMVREAAGAMHTDPTLPVGVREMPAKPTAVSLGVSEEHPLPVGLTAITPGAAWEPIRTKVEPAPTQPQPGRGGGSR